MHWWHGIGEVSWSGRNLNGSFFSFRFGQQTIRAASPMFVICITAHAPGFCKGVHNSWIGIDKWKVEDMKVLLAIDRCDSQVIINKQVTNRPCPSGTLFCVMSVVDLRHWEGLPELIHDAKYAAESVVKCAADKLTKSGHRAFAETTVGFPKEAITTYAKEWGADLIMVGSHGHGAVIRGLLGSVAQTVLRAAHCPVEIVRPAPESRVSAQGTKILLATDGSECSAKAVDFVATQPWPACSEVRILSVAQFVPTDVPSLATQFSAPVPSLMDELCKRARMQAGEAVASARKALMPTGLDIYHATPMGDPRVTILEEAKTCDADLIVLGSHGRHGLERFLMGSVAEAVAANATCSVAVVR
jgi:nucleotide-binding universal stress UspA family protein